LRILFASLLCLFLVLALTTVCMATSEDEVTSKISEANNALREAFKTVLEAEEAGANVSGLVAKLNEAGGFLSEAEMAYRNGDLDKAVSETAKCLTIANGILGDALALKSSALEDAQIMRTHTLLFSFAGAVVSVVGLFLVWVRFKPFYVRKLLKMKPEVASNAKD